MPEHMTPKEIGDEAWYWYLTGEYKLGFPDDLNRAMSRLFILHDNLPGSPRCLECHVPMGGVGGTVMRVFGTHPSMQTPRLCNRCEKWILSTESGAEAEISLLFADIRGSTSMAERTPTAEYKNFIQRFYKTAAGILIDHFALVNRLGGDQVIGLFVPRFNRANHSAEAIEAALEILRATGHENPEGPWAPVGIGVHTGMAYVGAVGSKDEVHEIAVLGNSANLTARLSSKAARGEILISPEAAAHANLHDKTLEKRRLKLKGITKVVSVQVMQVEPKKAVAARKKARAK
jgi:adenylate cyclase